MLMKEKFWVNFHKGNNFIDDGLNVEKTNIKVFIELGSVLNLK